MPNTSDLQQYNDYTRLALEAAHGWPGYSPLPAGFRKLFWNQQLENQQLAIIQSNVHAPVEPPSAHR